MKNIHKLSEHSGVNLHTGTGSSFVEDYDKPLQIKWGIAQINKKKQKGKKNIQQIGRTFTW